MKQVYNLLFIVLFLGAPTQLSAADETNYYALDRDGEAHKISPDLMVFETTADLRTIEHEMKFYFGRLTAKPTLQTLTDYTLRLIRAGKLKEGLEIFKRLSAKFPKEHVFHAYLGMAYEVNGDNKNALIHAKKALELDRFTHQESQWISIKILEAKIALEKDPGYLKNHSVLSLTMEQKKAEKVASQLLLQVKERFPFFNTPDPIMAELLRDLGDCYTESKSFEYGAAFYEIALNYYKSNDRSLTQKIATARSLHNQLKEAANTSATQLTKEYGGDGIKIVVIGKVDYTDVLKSFNPNPVDWKKLPSDPEELLGYVKDIKTTTTVISQEPDPSEAEDEKKDSNMGLIILIAMAALIPIILLLRKRMLR
jgi:tetratricopeptide (TPR) repeat protein